MNSIDLSSFILCECARRKESLFSPLQKALSTGAAASVHDVASCCRCQFGERRPIAMRCRDAASAQAAAADRSVTKRWRHPSQEPALPRPLLSTVFRDSRRTWTCEEEANCSPSCSFCFVVFPALDTSSEAALIFSRRLLSYWVHTVHWNRSQVGQNRRSISRLRRHTRAGQP